MTLHWGFLKLCEGGGITGDGPIFDDNGQTTRLSLLKADRSAAEKLKEEYLQRHSQNAWLGCITERLDSIQ